MSFLFRFSMIMLVAQMATSCYYEGKQTFIGEFVLVFFCMCILLGIVMIIRSRKSQKKKEKAAEEQMKRAEQEALLWQQKKDKYDAETQKLIDLYGKPDKVVQIEENNVDNEIRVYIKDKKVSIVNRMYDFSDILSCSFFDKQWIEKGKTTMTSVETSSINDDDAAVGAAFGGMVGGNLGAVMGASAADRTITTTNYVNQEPDIKHYNYVVVI